MPVPYGAGVPLHSSRRRKGKRIPHRPTQDFLPMQTIHEERVFPQGRPVVASQPLPVRVWPPIGCSGAISQVLAASPEVYVEPEPEVHMDRPPSRYAPTRPVPPPPLPVRRYGRFTVIPITIGQDNAAGAGEPHHPPDYPRPTVYRRAPGAVRVVRSATLPPLGRIPAPGRMRMLALRVSRFWRSFNLRLCFSKADNKPGSHRRHTL